MDIKYFEAMVLRGIGQAQLPITEIKRMNGSNNLLSIITSDNTQFLIKIQKSFEQQDSSAPEMKIKNGYKRIHKIFDSYVNSQEYNEGLMRNKFDMEWLKEKVNNKDYCKLEDQILEYCSKNDELIFELGFKYAWSLFCECIEGGTDIDSDNL